MTKRDDLEWTGNIIRDHQEQYRHFSFALREQSLSVLYTKVLSCYSHFSFHPLLSHSFALE